MLKTLRKNRKSLLGFLAVCAIVLVMTGLGVGFRDLRSLRDDYAVRVDDHKISRAEFLNQKRSLAERYRQMFGANMIEANPNLLSGIGQQVVDQFIADSVLTAEAARLDFFPPEGEARRIIGLELFPGGYDPARYTAFLRSIGMTAKEFEQKLAEDARKKQFTTLLGDAALPSAAEAIGLARHDETSFEVSYAEFTPANFEKDVDLGSEGKLKNFYDDNSTDYELPPRAAYEYIVFDPASFKDSVVVSDEDIELYYSDNESKYLTDEEVKARRILINIPKDADAAKRIELRKKADEILGKAASEPFEKLAAANSDDAKGKKSGGDLGWVKRGVRGKSFDDAVFKLKGPGLTDLISGPSTIEIVKVEAYKPSAARSLASVKAEIVEEIKKRDAPSYTFDKARELYDEFTKSAQSMSEFASAHKLKSQKTSGLLSKESDPSPALKGLTDQVLQFGDDKKQLVELPEAAILVSLVERRDAEIPEFAAVKAQVSERFKKAEAIKLAREKAETALSLVREGKKTLADAATGLRASLKSGNSVGKSKPGTGPLADTAILKSILSRTSPQEIPDRVFESEGKYYLVTVTAVRTPDEKTLQAKGGEYLELARTDAGQIMTESLINKRKAAAKIEIAPGVLGEG